MSGLAHANLTRFHGPFFFFLNDYYNSDVNLFSSSLFNVVQEWPINISKSGLSRNAHRCLDSSNNSSADVRACKR